MRPFIHISKKHLHYICFIIFILFTSSTLTSSILFCSIQSNNYTKKLPIQNDYIITLFTKKHNVHSRLISLIQNSKLSIYAALQELHYRPVTNALINARKRGLDVKIIIDNKYLKRKDVTLLMNANIPIVNDKRSAKMHNKFFVFDKRIVWTGSTNITARGLFHNNNNSLIIKSNKLAANFISEFNEMFHQNAFGIKSPKTIPFQSITIHNKNTEKIIIKTLFAPENNVKKHIVEELKKAKKSITFYAFSFTDKDISAVIIRKFLKGIPVLGLFEKFGISSYSQFHPMSKIGIKVKKDNNKYIMHHKVIIIDDYITITGSFNFSKNANKSNDENVLFIYSNAIANLYINEFKRIF